MIRTGLGRLLRQKASRGKASVLATQTRSQRTQSAFPEAVSQLINEGARAKQARDWARAAAYYKEALATYNEALATYKEALARVAEAP
jgi:hypothetical protein